MKRAHSSRRGLRGFAAFAVATLASGPAAPAEDEMQIVPFQVNVPEAALDDLRRRLAGARLPEQIPGVSWEYGTERGYLEGLLEYWANEFDWREQEARINAFDQFTTRIDDVDMHFIHQRSADPNAMPLMIAHGWPGSVSEFLDIMPPLTDPAAHGGDAEDSFHVVAPSLPGFGFSGIPRARGYSPERIAHMLAALMRRLGYESYAVAGGDWGAIINRHLANHYPERLIGLHTNMVLAPPPEDEEQRGRAAAEELALVGARADYMRDETGYQAIQGTKPQTLGYGLNDSPAGLAAWIAEKFHGWSDLPQGPDGNLDDNFSRDDLLTNISIYWFTGTITSSARIYYENRNTPPEKPIGYIDVPTGAAIFPAEIYLAPRAWVEAAYDLRHWTMMPRGGHFAALEQPELYLGDLREFFRSLR